jgi:hypothetical protein
MRRPLQTFFHEIASHCFLSLGFKVGNSRDRSLQSL